ncbi:MAG: GDSL-type esterase/lipase family protein [Verrucomicrobiae bacterium]|nr:GDSL-type esterase/lipase family protein [Verrucomicrobiae bacterium]
MQTAIAFSPIRVGKLFRRARLFVALALLAHLVSARADESGSTNRCVIPAPRTEEKATNRFAELNQRVEENAGRAQLIFVGDSITQGWEGNGKEVWAKYYAPRNALNLGIGSDHTQHVLWRLDHGNLDGLHPRVAVVLIGVNNAPDASNTSRMILEGVTAVVAKLREKLPQTKILLLGIFPFREDFNPQRAKVLEVNQALHKLDDGEWIHFLDFGYIFLDRDGRIPKDMMRDAVHPTPHGYQLWAEIMEPKLAELMGDEPVKP